jgi:mono/diheme cytochrome c family protein
MPNIPDFTDRAWQQSRSNVQLIISILEGKNLGGGQMPANRGMVSDELARELVVSCVRKFAPAPQPVTTKRPPTPPRTTDDPIKTSVEADRAYTPTGDFEVDFAHYAKEFDERQRRIEKLASAAKPTSPEVGSTDKNPPPTVISDNPPITELPKKPVESRPEKPAVAAVPISDRPFTADDVTRGEELFLGHRPLANGGQACITCHSVNRGEAREGGRIGPPLTKVYERLGGRPALSAHLWAPTTPTMRPTYRQHNLESDEVLVLTAYLEDADRHAAEAASPLPLTFLLLSLGGTVLVLAAFGTFWGRRSWRNSATLSGKVSPSLPTSRPKAAPSPVDCVGAGL